MADEQVTQQVMATLDEYHGLIDKVLDIYRNAKNARRKSTNQEEMVMMTNICAKCAKFLSIVENL